MWIDEDGEVGGLDQLFWMGIVWMADRKVIRLRYLPVKKRGGWINAGRTVSDYGQTWVSLGQGWNLLYGKRSQGES